jgi:CDP-paratose 2-epimerase
LWRFFRSPRSGEVYNLGGGRASNCSMLEAITIAERSVGRPLRWSYDDRSRIGDHIWWISDTSRFESHHPGWRIRRTVVEIVDEIHLALRERRDAANG